MNFFRGFAYEPTVDCDAMMAITGKEEMKKLKKKEGGRKKRREEKIDAFGRSKQRY